MNIFYVLLLFLCALMFIGGAYKIHPGLGIMASSALAFFIISILAE